MSRVTKADNLTLSGFFDMFDNYMQYYRNSSHAPSSSGNKILHSMYNDIRYVLNISNDVTTTPEVNTESWQYDSIEWLEIYDHSYHKYMEVRPILLCIILAILILVGIVGNVVVIMAAIRQNRHVTSALYAFLINLSVTNWLFLGFCIPLVIYENILMQSWTTGEAMCQFQRYVQYCCFYALTYALVLIVLWTLLQVMAPRQIAPVNNFPVGAGLSMFVWWIIMFGNIPNLLGHGLYDQIEGMKFCFHEAIHDDWNKVRQFIIVQFIFSYALPFIAMVTMSIMLLYYLLCKANASNYDNLDDNARFQRSCVTMNVTLTLMFALCWSPDRILSLILVYNPHTYGTYLFVIHDLFMVMACCNAASNPWIILFILRHTLGRTITNENSEITSRDNQTDGDVHSPNRAVRAMNGDIMNTTNIDTDTNHLTEYLEMSRDNQPENCMVHNL